MKWAKKAPLVISLHNKPKTKAIFFIADVKTSRIF